MMIIITPLKKALKSLKTGLDRAKKSPSDLEIRDACIQRFEYTYELSIKIIKRYIEENMPISERVDQLNYRDLLRVAFEIGLIQHVEEWFSYREARNQTSHAYDEIKAQAVYDILPAFFIQAEALVAQLDQRLGSTE